MEIEVKGLKVLGSSRWLGYTAEFTAAPVSEEVNVGRSIRLSSSDGNHYQDGKVIGMSTKINPDTGEIEMDIEMVVTGCGSIVK